MGKYLSDKEETESERQLALAFSVHISYIFIDKYFLNFILIYISIFIYLYKNRFLLLADIGFI